MWNGLQFWTNAWCCLLTVNVGRQCYFSLCLMCPQYKGYYYFLLVECTHLVMYVFILTPSQISHCNPQGYEMWRRHCFIMCALMQFWWLKMRNGFVPPSYSSPSKSRVEWDKLSLPAQCHAVLEDVPGKWCLVCTSRAVVPVDGGLPSEESREDIKPCVLFPVNFFTGPRDFPPALAASNDSSQS